MINEIVKSFIQIYSQGRNHTKHNFSVSCNLQDSCTVNMSYVKLIIYQSYVRERCTEHLYTLHYYTQLHTEWAENRRSRLLCVSWPNNNTQTNQPVSQPERERERTERDVNPDREIRKRTYCTHYQTPKKLLRPTLVKII